MANHNEVVALRLGEDAVVILRHGISAPICAAVLGREQGADGITRVYLDRLLHRAAETRFKNWRVSGAISTIIECETDSITEDDDVTFA